MLTSSNKPTKCEWLNKETCSVNISQMVCILRSYIVYCSATQLKPDEGTPELPEGRVRVRLETDGSLHDVTEYEIEKVAGLSSFFTPFCLLWTLFPVWQRLPLCLHSVTPPSWICARTSATCRVWMNVESCTRWPVELKPTCRSHMQDPT